MAPGIKISEFESRYCFCAEICLPEICAQKQLFAEQPLKCDVNPLHQLRSNFAEPPQKLQNQAPQKHPQKPRRNPRRNKPQKQNPD